MTSFGEPKDGSEIHEVSGRIHWRSLALRLPKGGVRSAFPDDEACRKRLREVRWPEGVACGKCGGRDVVALSTRVLFHCRKCKKQFSETSGTIMHRGHLPASMWFIAAEHLIFARAKPGRHSDLSSHEIADILGIRYESAWRLKKKLHLDLAGGEGLVCNAVCAGSICLPDHLTPGSLAHADWLIHQIWPETELARVLRWPLS